MFSQASPSIYQSSKCHVTYGSMGHIDAKQVPHKGKPWSSIMLLDFIHKVRLWVTVRKFMEICG
jgi:ribonucleases P/MRP protein subunit RPP40